MTGVAADIAVVIVASPLPQLDRELEYRIAPSLVGVVGPGMRVRVPVRTSRRMLDGFVVRVTDTPSFQGKLAELDTLVSRAPVLSPVVAALARAVADRQAGVMADVLRLAIPTRRARVESEWLAGHDEATGEQGATGEHEAIFDSGSAAAVAAAVGDEAGELLTGPPGARMAVRTPVGVASDGIPASLALLADIVAAHVAAGRGAILIVPDYRDVELSHRALVARLGTDLVRRADGATKPTQRAKDHLACLDGPCAVVGTRAAAYAPLDPLGVVVVWDDADESYLEPHAPYPHTREVVLERQRQSGCTLVLAAHAPSLEVTRLLELGWVRGLSAVKGRPRIVPSDAVVGEERLAHSARIPSIAWRTATEALEHGPVLVQVARAGYVPRTACATCFEAARCHTCNGPLRLDARSSVPRCSVCGTAEPEWRCDECGGERLRVAAVGVTRTAEELGRAFPGVPVIVADGETKRIEIADRPSLVIATRGAEPVTPNGYRAVLLLDGERMLAREALDAVADTLRWWSNAAALARDDATVVLVGGDEGPARSLRDWQQPEAAQTELAARRSLGFPPAVRVATVRGTRAEVDRALESIPALDRVRVDGPVPDDEDDASPDSTPPPIAETGGARPVVATLRFGYAEGPDIARALKTALVRAATAKQPASAGRRGGRASTLRVRLDEPGRF